MEALWFGAVSAMLATYVVLDGFDLGAGALHRFLARDEAERRAVLAAFGPYWDGNEVWLIAAGGTLYFAFPQLYASGFSGFYLPLMMVLWLLMLRAVGIEFRHHVQEPVWKGFFDTIFGLSSILLAIFFGAALGNVVRGVPLNADGYFFEPLWTNWRIGQQNGILDWYTVMCGVVALVTLVVHGSLYLANKTEGELNRRARNVASWLWPVQVLLTIFSLIATVWAVPGILTNYTRWPLGYLVPAVVIASLIFMYFAHARRNEKSAFLASCTYIITMLVGAVFALYPNVLPASTGAQYNLTIYNSATGAHGMSVGLVWWSIGMLLAAVYFVALYRIFKGKVSLEETSTHRY